MERHHPSGLLLAEDWQPTRTPTATPATSTPFPDWSFASKPVDTSDDRQRRLATEGSTDWQKEAWTYFDEVEEVKFAATFRGALMSRLILFAGVTVEPDQPPVPVADAPAGTLPAEIAAAAAAELERLGTVDQQAALFAQWGMVATVSAEAYLIGREDELGDTGEDWRLFSESNIVRDTTGRGIAVRTSPGGPPESVPDEAAKIRVWRPHARWPSLADSNMRSVLATSEELLIFARQFRAIGKGRNSAGLLYIANEIGDPPVSGGEPTEFEKRLVASQARAITEDGAPAAAMPYIVRGPAAFGVGQRQIPAKDAIFKVDLDRKIDEKAVERIDFLVKRLAHGLDVPVEVLTGIADINHWGAWQIEDSTYRAHIEPDALTFATAITREVVRAGLLDTFGPQALPWIRRIVVGINPAALVVRPNRGQDAKDAFDRGALSWAALREHLNFTEAEAPSPEELLLRLTLERSIGSATLTAPMLRETGLFPGVMAGLEEASDALDTTDDTSTDDGDEMPPAGGDQPVPQDDVPEPADPQAVGTSEQLSLLPADNPRPRFATAEQIAGLGDRLAAIDRALAGRLVTSASDALTSALRVIGNRLRSSAQGNPDMLAAIDGVDASNVGAALLAAGFALPDIGEMVDDSTWFEQLHERYDAWSSAAFAETSATIGAVTDEADRQEVADEVTAGQDERTGLGWGLLYAGLRQLAIDRTSHPTPPPAQGETDAFSLVPYSVVRGALQLAGGTLNPGTQPDGLAGEITDAGNTGGIATGPQTARGLRVAGYGFTSWTWNVGAPMEPFHPHHLLPGVTFTSWEDEVLRNFSGWPPFDHYFPGDHAGCQCWAFPLVAPITEG